MRTISQIQFITQSLAQIAAIEYIIVNYYIPHCPALSRKFPPVAETPVFILHRDILTGLPAKIRQFLPQFFRYFDRRMYCGRDL